MSQGRNMSTRTPAHKKKTTFRAGVALFAALLLGALAVTQGSHLTPAQAATALSCDQNTIYSIQSSGSPTGNLNAIDVTTGASTLVSNLSPSNNALGITAGGTAAYSTLNTTTDHSTDNGGTITKYDPSTGTESSITGVDVPANAYRGAVDPANGIYYYAQGNTATAALYAYDPSPTAANGGKIGLVGHISGLSASTGDMAFSTTGVLYLVSGNLVMRVNEAVPSATGDQALDVTTIATLASGTTSPGIAFSSNGYLYIAVNATLVKINPSSGAVVGSPLAISGGFSPTDLASCNYADSVTAEASVDTRAASSDQFALAITGNGLVQGAGNTATTTGTTPGLQTQKGAVAGPALAIASPSAAPVNYTVTETGSGTTNLANYTTSYVCTNPNTSPATTFSGTGTTATFSLPAATSTDDDYTCVFTNKLVATVTKDQSYKTPAGTALTVPQSTGLLAGDQGANLTVTGIDQQPTGGTVSNLNSSTGAFTYTPNAGFAGRDSFTYTVTDPRGAQTTQTATIVVGPIAVNDKNSVVNGGSVSTTATSGGVLANDTGDQLVASNPTQPAHGQVTLASDGSYTYTSTDTSFSGVDTWSYTATDSAGQTATANVAITVKPLAVNDSLPNATIGTPLVEPTSASLANDQGANLTVTGVGTPTHGSVALSSDGKNFTYTPAADYSGPDSFTYTVSDGTNSSTATESLTVLPLAVPDTTPNTADGVPDAIGSASLITNDHGSGLTVTGVSSASNGTVSLSADHKTITFTPAANFSGYATFQYTATDTFGNSAQPVTVTVPVNPTAVDDTATAASGTPLVVSSQNGVLSNDNGSGLTAKIATPPADGTLSLSSNGAYTYTASSTFSGVDSFTYTATDTHGTTSTATVTITVDPMAEADSVQATADTTLPLTAQSLLANDNGANLRIVSVTQPSNGTVALSADGSTVTYTPTDHYSGTDDFTYTISDGTNTSTADVQVTVAPKVVTEQLPSISTGGTESLAQSVFTGNDDGTGPLTVTAVGPASVGTVTLNSDHSITYQAPAGFSGTFDVPYTVTDANGVSASGVDTVIVTPTAGPLTSTAVSGSPDSVSSSNGLLSNASGSSLVASVTQPADGTVTLGDDGAYVFTPNSTFSGTEVIDYSVSDGTSTVSNTITVTVAPKANADVVPATADTPVTFAATDLLKNDDGSALKITAVTDPATGTLVDNGDGTFTYTPATDASGPVTFTYTVTDASGQKSTATVTIDVAAVVQNDSASTTANTSVVKTSTDGVLSNDTGTGLKASVASDVSDGKLTLQSNGAYTYVPNTDFSGSDSFTYTATDSSGATQNGTVTITVTPTAGKDSFTDAAGVTLHRDAPSVLGNDHGSSLVITTVGASGATGAAVATPAGGTVTLGSDGTLDYVPAAHYSGTDTFPYTVTDAAGQTVSATIAVTVTPTAVDDQLVTPANTALSITGATLTGNDLGSGLGVTSVTSPGHGTLTPSGTSYVYTPDNDFSGTDSFTYTATDSSNQTTTATVRIIVGNQAADYSDTGASAAHAGSPLGVPASTGLLSQGSGTAESTALDAAPSHGKVVVNPDGSYTYTPAAGYSGPDSFTYTATDSSGQTSTGVVTIAVLPTAVNDRGNTDANTAYQLAAPGVLANDRGTNLRVVSVGTPNHGTVTLSGAGALDYTPTNGYSGTDSFSYTVEDEANQPATATITITVGVTASNDTGLTLENTTLVVPASRGVLVNDRGDHLSAALLTQASHGTVELAADGSYRYTPATGYVGTDSFTYTATDVNGVTATAKVTITIPKPAAGVNDSGKGKTGTSTTIDPFSNDSPTAGSTIEASTLKLIDPSTGTEVSRFTIPGKGTFAVTNGLVTFTPVSGFGGTATIGYRATDSDGAVITASITVTYPAFVSRPSSSTAPKTPVAVAPAADPSGPVAKALAFTGSAPVGGALLIALLAVALGITLKIRPGLRPRRRRRQE